MALWASHWHRRLYIGCLLAIPLVFSFSRYLLSSLLFVIAINWLLEGQWAYKFRSRQRNRQLMVFTSFYLMLVIAFFYSENKSGALNVLRVSAPMVVLPWVMGTSAPLNARQLKWVLYSFALGVAVHALVSSLLYWNEARFGIQNFRQISFFYSHIRQSLSVNIALFSLLYVNYRYPLRWFERGATLVTIVALLLFLFIIKSLTGILVFLLLAGYTAATVLIHSQRHRLLWASGVLALGGILYLLILGQRARQQFIVHPIKRDTLQMVTANGNTYRHNVQHTQMENGHHVWIYIARDELRSEWNERSQISYQGLDAKGHHIKYTLIRYLTAKGLRKDSAGVAALLPQDIRAIEQGYSNPIYTQRMTLYPRIYELFWEWHKYQYTGKPEGSLTQRLIAWQTGWHIIRQQPVWGVGPGDLANTYKAIYSKQFPGVKHVRKLIGHNQYIRYLGGLGVVGLLWFLLAVFYPYLARHGYQRYLVNVILIVIFTSMLTDDTLNRQIGIIQFSFFYSLFLFASPKP